MEKRKSQMANSDGTCLVQLIEFTELRERQWIVKVATTMINYI